MAASGPRYFCRCKAPRESRGGLPDMSDQEDDEETLRAELSRLEQEHRDLDGAIAALERLGTGDRLQVQRLKKRKLSLRDRISFLEDALTPDIIA